ncbi:hypothetical protein GOP47_0012927 [Adiantum capillus-veneris]|uniref:Uncharacterized protein n=1 Tax=Adiantum capillus-veneris TaxID=13818 RepID=A0A9D4ZH96_ADICA|nr:hypothetical protein GOP47_0012927 [Adiantum capillus-veneris]
MPSAGACQAAPPRCSAPRAPALLAALSLARCSPSPSLLTPTLEPRMACRTRPYLTHVSSPFDMWFSSPESRKRKSERDREGRNALCRCVSSCPSSLQCPASSGFARRPFPCEVFTLAFALDTYP